MDKPMTTFNPDKPIYLQMAERLCDEILAGTYSDDDRVPSVREYAVMLEVNTNTAVKAYDALARDNVIYNRRGLGYFVSPGARGRILSARRRDFMDHTLPSVFRDMRLLGISIGDIVGAWQATDGGLGDQPGGSDGGQG